MKIPGIPRVTKIQAKEMQLFWDRFFSDEMYRENLKERILRGRAGHMEVLLHHMVYGKPKETLELQGAGDGILILQIGNKIVRAQQLEDGTVKALPEGVTDAEVVAAPGGESVEPDA